MICNSYILRKGTTWQQRNLIYKFMSCTIKGGKIAR